jgi:hypothetical protein
MYPEKEIMKYLEKANQNGSLQDNKAIYEFLEKMNINVD